MASGVHGRDWINGGGFAFGLAINGGGPAFGLVINGGGIGLGVSVSVSAYRQRMAKRTGLEDTRKPNTQF